MLKKNIFILILFLLGISGEIFSHPLHLTITNIEISNDSIKVAIRLFSDDIKLAILDFNAHENPATQTDTINLTIENIDAYINAYFKISDSSGYLPLKNSRNCMDELSLWVYLNGQLKNGDKYLIIENNLLNNLFGDQRNMVIISNNKNEVGLEFNTTETKKTITLVD